MTTQKILPGAIVAVPESQKADYAGVGLDVLTHPDSIKGLTPKLNWLLEKFADEDLFFADDDLVSLQRCFLGPDDRDPRAIKEPELILELLQQTQQLAADVGAFLWGFEASGGAIRYYTGLKPMALTGYINGCAIGFRKNHGLKFDERIVAKNDYDICAMNTWRHRKCFKNLRYCFTQKETFVGKGGQSAYRTSATEERDVELLLKKYGPVIRAGGHSGARKRDYAGAKKIELILPF